MDSIRKENTDRMSGGELCPEQHNLKEQLCLVCTMLKDKLIATILTKSLKVQSNIPTISCFNNIMG